ncbi:hypothetical protein BJX64DRAFT_255960 [Aspergillus heterothallicus]
MSRHISRIWVDFHTHLSLMPLAGLQKSISMIAPALSAYPFGVFFTASLCTCISTTGNQRPFNFRARLSPKTSQTAFL